MTTDQLLRSAVSKLGPIAAANALTAFETGERKSWNSCVLARAYGADGELRRDAREHPPRSVYALGPTTLGLTRDEWDRVAAAFDGALGHPMYCLLHDLLRAEASKIATVPSPARGSAEQSEAAPDSLAFLSR